MTLGALGLISGPWLNVSIFTVVGLILHTLGSILLLVIVVKPLLGDHRAWTPGMWHLLTSYIWFFIPVVVAPLIVARATDFPVQEISGSGGPILIFGWILQFGYALVPYLFTRFFEPNKAARLGGTWLSLFTVHLGGILFWVSLFFPDVESVVRALAYGFWIVSGLPILISLWRSLRSGMQKVEETQAVNLEEGTP